MDTTVISDFPRNLGEQSDSPRIQRAIDACPIGGTLYFPPDQYIVDRTVYVWKGIRLTGSGTAHEAKAYNHHAQFLIRGDIVAFLFDIDYTPTSSVVVGKEKKPFYDAQAVFDNLKFRGTTSKTSTTSQQTAIGTRQFVGGQVINCHFNALANGIVLQAVWTAVIRTNAFQDVTYAVRSDPDFSPVLGVRDSQTGKYWYQLNQVHISNNEMSNLGYGIFIRTPGNMITIENNTIEACIHAGVYVSAYDGQRMEDKTLLDINESLYGVVVRENYFEANGVHIEIGSVREKVARGANNVEIKLNQFNFSRISSHRCIRIHSLFDSYIGNNSVRNFGSETLDIAINPAGSYRNVKVEAELGYGGFFPDLSANVVATTRNLTTLRPFNVLYVSAEHDNRVTGSRISGLFAGTADQPFATLADLYAFFRYRSDHYESVHYDNIMVFIDPGKYREKICGITGVPVVYAPSPRALSGEDDSIEFNGVITMFMQPVRINGRNKIIFRPNPLTEFNPVLFGYSGSLSECKIQYDGPGGNGTKAITVSGGIVNVVNYSLKGANQPQYGAGVDGGVLVRGGKRPSGSLSETHIGSSGGLIV